MHAIPYRHFHLASLTPQEAQATMAELIKPEYAKALEIAGPAWTVMDGSEVLACLGLAEQWPTRAQAWTILSNNLTGRRFAKFHAMVMRGLGMQSYTRIEMTVDHEFEQGHRWAKLLGFEWEGLMRKYNPNGMDCDLYARVK